MQRDHDQELRDTPLLLQHEQGASNHGRGETAREHFRAALALARNPMEREFLEQRLEAYAAALASRPSDRRRHICAVKAPCGPCRREPCSAGGLRGP